VLGCILTSECVIALLNTFFDPSCIVKIFFTTSVRIVLSVLKILKVLFSGIMWNMWLGKYSEPNKKRFRPGLTMIALAVSSVRPFFVFVNLELPVQSKSLLEHAKRLRADYSNNRERNREGIGVKGKVMTENVERIGME
jgi:hypothetical protein